MNQSSGALRRLAIVALALAAIVLMAGLTPWPVNREGWRATLAGQVRAATGARTVDLGDMSLTLLPYPQVEVTATALDQESLALAGTVAFTRFTLAPLSLILGEARATHVALDGADITLRVPKMPDLEPRAMARQVSDLSAALDRAAGASGIGGLAMTRSHLRIESLHGAGQALRDVTLTVEFANPARPVKLDLKAARADGPVRLSFAGAPPAMLASDALEPVSFAFSGPDWSLDFRGKGHFSADAAINGALHATLPITPPFASLATPAEAAPLRATISALVEGTGRGATLSDLTIRAGDDRYAGVGAARVDAGRWQISATLATDKADISWLAAPLMRLREAGGGWRTSRVSFDDALGFNLDLRLSADQLKVNRSTFQRAAFTLLSRPARFEASLGDARLNGGKARFRALFSPSSDGVDLKVSSQVEDADIGATFSEFGIGPIVRGTGSGTLSLEASGRSIAELVASSNGRVQLSVQNGDLIGIDLHRLADRRPSRPDAALAEALSGKTSFEILTLASRVIQGAVGPVDGRLQAGRIVGALQGIIDLSQGQHRLGGTVVQVGGEAFQIEPVPVLEFSIGGPLTTPKFEPNLSSLLKRS